jgi:hypothetical protein
LLAEGASVSVGHRGAGTVARESKVITQDGPKIITSRWVSEADSTTYL